MSNIRALLTSSHCVRMSKQTHLKTLDATAHNAIRAARDCPTVIRKLPSHYGPMWPKHDYQTRLTDAEIAAQIESTLRKFFSARVMPR